MTTHLVTRHPGALEWLERAGTHAERHVEHLDVAEVARGDTVIGTLPVPLAAEVCRRGARYVHLVVDLPPGLRGRELDAQALGRLGARLAEYHVTAVDPVT